MSLNAPEGAGSAGSGLAGPAVVPRDSPARQLSLFGVEAAEPVPADLAGLLAAGGRVVRMGGTARVSVVVDAGWRVHVLAAEFARRGLVAGWQPVGPEGPGEAVDPAEPDHPDEHLQPDDQFEPDEQFEPHEQPEPGGQPEPQELLEPGEQPGPGERLEPEQHVEPDGPRSRPEGGHRSGLVVRTAYTSALSPLARAWLRGPLQRPPVGFFLSGPRLRFWVAAAGVAQPMGYLLRLGGSDEHNWEPVGAALAAVGLPGVLLGPGADGPGYRITGRRRLARLAELVGERPAVVPAHAWPTV